MSTEKTKGELLKEKLSLDRENSGILMSEEAQKTAFLFCESYKDFLDKAKTEREAVEYFLPIVKENGYKEFDPKAKYQAGDKVFYNNRGKALIIATIGEKSMSEGVKILASHIDSPRIDLKPCPLYEQGQIALFKTHYYGGIKKYQWTALPLSLHGVIIKKNGEKIKVSIGEKDDEPVFCISDLLPHLANEQMGRKLKDGIKGEELNVWAGITPYNDEKVTEKVKLNILSILNEKYGITESDFLSSDLCFVPSLKAKDVGFDRSMVGAYGHDDRVCAYTSMMAAIEAENAEYTHVTVITDKEETGSDSNTGLNSAYLKYFIANLVATEGIEARTVLSKSRCLSADVSVAFDPTFPEVTEKNNTAYLNYGVCIVKYTGARGKGDTSEATAEFMAYVRNILDKKDVIWQTGELGKVDEGGGGTVAKYIAALDVDVVDVGVPVISMHSPFEIVSKNDVFMTYRAFKEFLLDEE
ncbi:MAG: aminopeptidase [Oscillospiraceae bacterium]